MNAINAVLWLAKLLTTYSVVDSTNKMTTASFCFQSVYEEDLDKVFSTSKIYPETIRLFALNFYA